MIPLKKLGLLGSTGSIGSQTLSVVDWFGDEFEIAVLAAGSQYESLAAQAKRYRPALIALADARHYRALKDLLPNYHGEILCGEEGVLAAASYPVDIMVHGIAGLAGLAPLLAAIEVGNTLAFANKESLVTAGHLVMPLARKRGVTLLPVDSEHSAIFQCLQGGRTALAKLILTASGGPFRNFTKEEMEHITVEMALAHPTWQMGPKVTVDSATMMNKGLEVIEAHWLFDVPYGQIDVLIQPKSLVHSMVSFVDGSFLAHLGQADMRIPIQFALTYPERRANPLPPVDFATLGPIEFFEPQREKFPLLDLAYEAGKMGGSLPAVMNAANEFMVYKFLAHRIKYKEIYYYTEKAMTAHTRISRPTLAEILAVQEWTQHWLEEVL